MKLMRTLFIIGLCYIFLFPVYYFMVTAFQDPLTARTHVVVWIPSHLTLENLRLAMELMNYEATLARTFTVTVFSTLGLLVSCSTVGYGFARFEFFEKKLAFIFVILIIIVPPQITMVPSFLNFLNFDFLGIMRLTQALGITENNHINLLRTIWTFILPSMFASGLRAGLFIFIFRQFFTNLPKELEEAARIDGCGAVTTFLRVIVPLTGPAFITVLLFSLVWHWNDSHIAGLFLDGQTVAVQLNRLITTFTNNIGHAYEMMQMRGGLAAGSLLMISPMLILYVFLQRYFTESIERAGIVG
jgi:multiple sugar transport system permease protein